VQNAAVPSSFGCCHRHELNRAKPADWGASDVAAPADVDASSDRAGAAAPADP
jgi:hypothetical protein